MNAFLDRFRTRLLPAVLTASGVMLVAAGLLSYSGPVDAQPPSGPASPVETPAASPTPSPPPTPTPSSAAPPSPSASPFPADRVATRVVVPALGIDLPVIKPPGGPDAYPVCNVAMYLEANSLGQPGQGRATYLYAHARKGMFLPILEASLVNDGARMVGMLVQVYTSDNQLFLYEVTEVRRHQTSLHDALTADSEQLWLQTSEGPRGTPGKTQLISLPLSSGPADPADARPTPEPVVCH